MDPAATGDGEHSPVTAPKTPGVSAVDGKLTRSYEIGRCLTPATHMVPDRSALQKSSGFRVRFDAPSPSSLRMRA